MSGVNAVIQILFEGQAQRKAIFEISAPRAELPAWSHHRRGAQYQ